MKNILVFLGFLSNIIIVNAQVKQRMIFIGNAGVNSPTQKTIISKAAQSVLPEKTSVIFMGNNIYPDGMALKTGEAQNRDQNILKSQYAPFKNKGAQTYFIPGNRDWDKSGVKGLAKVQQQQNFLESRDSTIDMLPKDGCPGPSVTHLSDNLIMITVDSEWWLFPFEKKNDNTDCDCQTTDEAVLKLRKVLYRNLDKSIILVTHHPFQSQGKYGGKFSLREHIFPLTDLNKNLYLPLPGVGSLYPLFKKAFPGKEDLHHPFYQQMSRDISKVFKGFPNIIHVSAHENGLQYITDSSAVMPQIVTGIGRQAPYLKRGDHTIFQSEQTGFVVVDLTEDRQLRVKFYGCDHKTGQIETRHKFTKPYRVRENWESPVYTPIKSDSTRVAVHPEYVKRKGFYRFLFGENYRDAWAAKAKLPVLHLSKLKGGLKMRKLGGGHQTVSMRLKDSTGYQYVLRSVEKTPDRVIPERFRSPFTRKLVEDFFSSQHPFSALMVPPIAHAVEVPHTNPVIGLVSPDSTLEQFAPRFANKVNLFEAWEPLQPTDNYRKALKKLRHDNDNTFDGINFLKARMLDLLIGDWDRHLDQWRFNDQKKGTHKNYLVVPRDRDMVINVTNGLLVEFGKYFFLTPHVYGFKENLTGQVNQYMYKSDFLNAEPAAQIGYKQWMAKAHEFKNEVTDSVLRASIKAMPDGLDPEENDKILNILKDRRNQIPEAMKKYYKFSNKIVDIRGTNRKEFVRINGLKDRDALHILMRKINKHGKLKDTLMEKTYPRSITKEIRLYLEKDRDSVVVDNSSSTIKLRFIGGKPRHDSHKSYNIVNSKKKIKVYDYQREAYYGKTDRLRKQISKDSANTAFDAVNLYNDWLPLADAGFNRDDGFYLGLGAKFIQRRGFRKNPYLAEHKLMLTHSLHTNAYEIHYNGDWTDVVGKADLVVDADVKAPKNTQNFFGLGNESEYRKVGNHHSYYRTRFDLYNFKTALKWVWQNHTLSIGPNAQYYHYNSKNNIYRYTNEVSDPFSPDSARIAKDKFHIGLKAHYELDKRNDPLLPTQGFRVKIGLSAQTGVSSYAEPFAQITPEISFYKALNPSKSLVLTDRLGGAATVGNPSFYQYAYIGGQGNLLGYRKYRFAGKGSLYNNLELRLKLTDFGNPYFKGQLGLTGFYDVGRVWIDDEHSSKWHNGVGGGLYFAPAYSAVLHFDMGYSKEGWYPYVSFGLRL